MFKLTETTFSEKKNKLANKQVYFLEICVANNSVENSLERAS